MIVNDRIYDAAVRALLRCPDIPAHAHISIEHLRASVDDPEALRAALGAAIDEWELNDCDRDVRALSQGPATGGRDDWLPDADERLCQRGGPW
jgi:hypothetical protein